MASAAAIICSRLSSRRAVVASVAQVLPSMITTPAVSRSHDAHGKIINTYLSTSAHIDDHLIHLLFAANRREHERAMRDMLAQGTHLVWCMRPDVGLPEPDLVVYLDLSPEAAAKRGGYGEERYETSEMQGKVRHLFLDKLKDDRYWKVVDAGKRVEEVHADIMAQVDKVVQRVSGTHHGEKEQMVPPVRSLWEGRVERLERWPTEIKDGQQRQDMVAKCS
ncbi:hypothetical protein BCR44DRAFT_1423528 [Catenaria anguillulae PL171]|uniref:Thymidylate kinase-like domain-containing protein n=1 Tax=Catenaria anguillulae PL171 TaxID=765915 RepID=A0A1Y2I3V8_9FUNG|nr:hypothetical protein BCR44DRAFT_1423528 [Catenaria anguillulae PL171]